MGTVLEVGYIFLIIITLVDASTPMYIIMKVLRQTLKYIHENSICFLIEPPTGKL